MTEVNPQVNRGTSIAVGELLNKSWLRENIKEDTKAAFGGLLTYLDSDPREQMKVSIEDRAKLLDTALQTFTSEDLLQREILLRILELFVMHTIKNAGGEVIFATIDSQVLESLADPIESNRLNRAAMQLSKVTFITNQGEEINPFYRGTFELTELHRNGRIKAHVFNRNGGGLAHSQEFGTLARFSLMKALLGHHCLLARDRKEFYPNGISWIYHTANNWEMGFYFELAVGLTRNYIGNYNRIGASGVEMTREQINIQAGKSLDLKNKYWEFFFAGFADEFGALIISRIRRLIRGGKDVTNLIIQLSKKLDTERGH